MGNDDAGWLIKHLRSTQGDLLWLVLRSARSICLLAHRPSGAESVASATVPYLELGKCRALNDKKKTGIYNFLVALCHDIVGKLGMSPPAGGGS